METEDEVLVLDFDTTTSMKKMISQFTCDYRNIVSEFADVEIFIISLDSLIVECLAHSYHDWTLAGQSIVLTTQIDKFLQQFVNFGGKFKLVVFTDFASSVRTRHYPRFRSCHSNRTRFHWTLRKVLDALSQAVPVVMLTSVVVNFSSVSAYYIEPRLCVKYNWESFTAAHWECNSSLLKLTKTPTYDASSIKSVGELWAQIIVAAKSR
ncbi:hypothetical protein COOONC_03777 [Cooperia oncophora]